MYFSSGCYRLKSLVLDARQKSLVVDARQKSREFCLMIMIMIIIIQTLYQKFTDVVIPPFIVDSTWCHLEGKIKSSFCVFVHWYIDRFNSSALMMAN